MTGLPHLLLSTVLLAMLGPAQQAEIADAPAWSVERVALAKGPARNRIEVEVAAPSSQALPSGPASIAIRAKGKGGPTETLSLELGKIQTRYRESRPLPASPGSYTVRAAHQSAEGKTLATLYCHVAFAPGNACKTKRGGRVEIRADGDDRLQVVYTGPTTVAGVPSEVVALSITPDEGSAELGAATAVERGVVASGAVPTAVREGDASYLVDVGLGGVSATMEMKGQFGEILIDGVVWELE